MKCTLIQEFEMFKFVDYPDKVKLNSNGKSLFGVDEIPYSETSVDKINGRTFYHHILILDDKHYEGRLSEILTDKH